MTEALIGEYSRHYATVLVSIAPRLEALIRDHLKGVADIEGVVARAKDPDRFVRKALKPNPDGTQKYPAPLARIQDQLGARVILYYKADVEPISERILKYFRAIEEKELVPDSESAFGYFGRHFTLALPPDAVPAEVPTDLAPRFFKLQIKTLFQHAWAEANQI